MKIRYILPFLLGFPIPAKANDPILFQNRLEAFIASEWPGSTYFEALAFDGATWVSTVVIYGYPNNRRACQTILSAAQAESPKREFRCRDATQYQTIDPSEIAEIREPYVMRDACIIAELLGYRKIDERWYKDGRSIWRGQLPISGTFSTILAELRLSSDAISLREYVKLFNIAAEYYSAPKAIYPDIASSETLIKSIDDTVNFILRRLTVDPWSSCDFNNK